MSAPRGFLLAGLVATALLATPAAAQRSSGGISGKAAPGTVVTVHNQGSNLHRELTVVDGRYHFGNLPTGTYSVTLTHPDGSSREPILVLVRGGISTRVR